MNVSWRQDEEYIKIYVNDKFIFNIWIGEAIEKLPKYKIMKIVKNCDNTPWLRNWHKIENKNDNI